MWLEMRIDIQEVVLTKYGNETIKIMYIHSRVSFYTHFQYVKNKDRSKEKKKDYPTCLLL